MIKLHHQGRLGNQLILYSFARILAEKTHCRLECKPIPGFPHAVPIRVKKEVCPLGTSLVIRGHKVDINHLERILSSGGQLKLCGYFQRTEYYLKNKSLMKNWCNPNISPTINHPYVAVHVRWGDVANENLNKAPIEGHHSCPINYYEYCLRKFSELDLPIFIVTENPNSKLVVELREKFPKVVIHSNSPVEDMSILMRADYLVMSQGTFSWVPAFLGNAKKVFFPLIGYWHPRSKRRDVYHYIPEDRFSYLDCVDLTERNFDRLISDFNYPNLKNLSIP